MALGAILYDNELVLSGQFEDGIKVAGSSGQMNSHDGPCFRGQNLGDGSGGEVLTVPVDVGEDRPGPGQSYPAAGGDKSPRGHDDLVAVTDSQSMESQFKGNRSIGQGMAYLEPQNSLNSS